MKAFIYKIERIELNFDSLTDMEQAAIERASRYGLENEVKELIDLGYTPQEALEEWDLPPLQQLQKWDM